MKANAKSSERRVKSNFCFSMAFMRGFWSSPCAPCIWRHHAFMIPRVAGDCPRKTTAKLCGRYLYESTGNGSEITGMSTSFFSQII